MSLICAYRLSTDLRTFLASAATLADSMLRWSGVNEGCSANSWSRLEIARGFLRLHGVVDVLLDDAEVGYCLDALLLDLLEHVVGELILVEPLEFLDLPVVSNGVQSMKKSAFTRLLGSASSIVSWYRLLYESSFLHRITTASSRPVNSARRFSFFSPSSRIRSSSFRAVGISSQSFRSL